jgi:uridylate kinase
MAMENKLPMMVFALERENGIIDAARGINNGTLITA